MTHPAIAPPLAELARRPSRTWSLVITVFGDAVVPRGGAIWLGSLLEIFAGMDIGAGVVRTAVSRLAADGWLARRRIGRHSFYRLTARGEASTRQAAARIYGAPPAVWDGAVRLLIAAAPLDEPARASLAAAGFGGIGGTLFVAPGTAPVPPIPGLLPLAATATPAVGQALAIQAWKLDALASAYERFLATFAPLHRLARHGPELQDRDALIARILLIHEYRRIVLRDPLLPAPLLPPAWPGARARRACAEIYAWLLAGSERWLGAHGRNEAGPLPPPSLDMARRFAWD